MSWELAPTSTLLVIFPLAMGGESSASKKAWSSYLFVFVFSIGIIIVVFIFQTWWAQWVFMFFNTTPPPLERKTFILFLNCKLPRNILRLTKNGIVPYKNSARNLQYFCQNLNSLITKKHEYRTKRGQPPKGGGWNLFLEEATHIFCC